MIPPGTLARFTPWLAKPLAHAAKEEHFRKTLNYHAESVLMGRSALVAGWSVGGVGVALILVSMWGWITFLPLARTTDRIWIADQTTGIIAQPLSLEDAPKSMPAASDRYYIRQYIELCAGWVPELDRRNAYRCKLMSRPDQQERYNAWRKTPDSPMNAIGTSGHVEQDNFRYHVEPRSGQTLSYRVQYDQSSWKGTQKESTAGWTATIDFQWHPELPMTDADRQLNPGGFQAIAFTPNPDTPSPRRK